MLAILLRHHTDSMNRHHMQSGCATQVRKMLINQLLLIVCWTTHIANCVGKGPRKNTGWLWNSSAKMLINQFAVKKN
jgi:hypothetical protein